MLEGDGPVLETARDVSHAMHDARVRAAVVGGVAVGLHGHLRTTRDVDVIVDDDLARAGAALTSRGYSFEPRRREFVRAEASSVPVHLVTIAQAGGPPTRLTTIDGVQTVSLADLVSMKLHSGTANVLRSQDIADVIGLIRARRLRGDFAARLRREVRREFRTLVRAVEGDRRASR